MQHTELKSSKHLKSAAYDPETQELEVRFESGKIYRYDQVPEYKFDMLLKSKSAGSYFHRQIKKGPYKSRRIEE